MDNEELDTGDKEQDRDLERLESELTDPEGNGKSGMMGRKYTSPEYMDSNNGTVQQVNNYASAYNHGNSLSDTNIIQENASKIINSEMISGTSTSMNVVNCDSAICSKIDPKIVPTSQISEHGQEENSSIHNCPYCNIMGHDTTFSNTDLLEKYVVQRHVGCPGYLNQEEIANLLI
jgi:hypothetical protein